ncbi:30S ribosomal protein S11 [Candidatus Peregrinibacteria bacterium]|nr:30S ribosomal protein S11 [Candidatus Peregrinibacteria bacterium]
MTEPKTPASSEAPAPSAKSASPATVKAEEGKTAKKKTAAEKKGRRAVPEANIFITASYNNTIMSVAEPNGNVLAWASAGGCGFKGTRKSTPYAATITAEKLMEKASPFGIERVKIFVKGVGTGREQAIRGLQAAGLELKAIFDTTPVPHNGCRKKKARRN